MNKVSKESKLDKLITSEFHYYFGRWANVALVLFFLLQPLARNPLSYTVGWGATTILFFVGYLTWTLVEYVMHRWLYHEVPSILSDGHEQHHEHPTSLLGIPWIVNTVLILAIFTGVSTFLPRAESGVFIGALWFGYLNYTLVHHGLHHWKINHHVWRALWRHHKIHHKLPDKNIGVSTTFWDYVFRTKV